MRFCTAAGSGEAGPPCPPGRAASCRSHRAGVPNPNPNPIPIPNPYPTPNPSPAPKPSPKPYPTFVLLAARIRWRWICRPWTRSWSRSRSQKRRRRSGRAARLAASVVAHTDQAGEFEAYGFPATNALRHNGVPRRCPTLSLSLTPSPNPEGKVG